MKEVHSDIEKKRVEEKKYDVVIPIAAKDVNATKALLGFWTKYLPMKELIFVGNQDVLEVLREYPHQVRFINEEEVVSFSTIQNLICQRTNGNGEAIKRAGWYLQQFLKLEYAKLCEDEYYLVWDADTTPTRRIQMHIDGHPIFDMKTEVHMPYFHTIEKLFPDIKKAEQRSFISEHMLIHKAAAIEMIKQIEENQTLPGTHWYEKVINAISLTELSRSGFSEYETYGTYCTQYYPDLYKMRTWDSLREAAQYFKPQKLKSHTLEWLSKEFDALSFESEQERVRQYPLFSVGFLQKRYSFAQLKDLLLPEK